ncbi:hypothetical protein HK22_02170 [Gluconobacter sp. DsW_056]|uniref:hypothetical protein n=1 Tax=Gluconobacter sp. DsW_056 TaxID=1511209 RepID=UPI000B653454|nr:hypothetical protein [Gluconobacter sp. DsW_056]OUI81683.1 hypothetical protein HK22_02170 [Gluconobacter sp. DsW_056]
MIHQQLPDGFDALDIEQQNIDLLDGLYHVIFPKPKLASLETMEQAVSWCKIKGLRIRYMSDLTYDRLSPDRDIVWLSARAEFGETLWFHHPSDAIAFKLAFA